MKTKNKKYNKKILNWYLFNRRFLYMTKFRISKAQYQKITDSNFEE